MKSKLLSNEGGLRTFAIVFDTGDEVSSGLLAFAKQQHLGGSHFTAIGALQDVTLGYFDWNTRAYKHIPIDEQVEVVSLIGDVALLDASPSGASKQQYKAGSQPDVKVHAHIVVATSDGNAHGGHLLGGHVRPTLEVMLTETPTNLVRRHDDETGLALIRL